MQHNNYSLKRFSLLDIILSSMALSSFNFLGVRISSLVFLMCLIAKLFKSFKVNKFIFCLLILWLPWLFLSLNERRSLDLQNLSIQFGYLRPLLTYIQIATELLFIGSCFKYNFKNSFTEKTQMLTLFDFIMLFTLIMYFFSEVLGLPRLVDVVGARYDAYNFRGLANEPGPLSFTLITRLLIFKPKLNFNSILIASISVLAIFISKSSLIFFVPFITIYYSGLYKKFSIANVLFFILSAISLLFGIFFEGQNTFWKYELLLDPTIGSGRYAANLISIDAILANPIIGYGMNSFDNVRRISQFSYLSSNFYDHGGSDFLNLILDYGILGLLLIFLILFIILRKTDNPLILSIIFIGLSIKGQGIYSIGYLTQWSIILYYFSLLKIQKNDSLKQDKYII